MGRISKIHPIILLLLILLLISFGCNRTGEPPLVVTTHRLASTDSGSGIQAPLFTSTSTAAAVTTFSTPSPTPRIDPAHGLREWMPSPILIQAGTIHDQKRDPFDRDPFFILYADGTLIQKDCVDNSCDYTSVQINTKQICSLLNTIDLYGFFDFDPSSYVTPLVGGEITYLEVNAWRNQSVALYQLQDWLEDPDWLNRILGCDDCRKAPEIKPALAKTYWLLNGYTPPGATTYHPIKLAVWLSTPELAGEPVKWSLQSPTLSRLAGMTRCANSGQQKAAMLSGREAELLASYLNQITNQGLSPIFSEDGSIYQVTTRWLLPYEEAAGCGESTNQFPSTDIPLPNALLSCRSSDGFIPTATLTPVY